MGRISVSSDYHTILDETGLGHRAGIKGQVRLGPASELRPSERNSGFSGCRTAATTRPICSMLHVLPTLLLTLDGDAYLFAELVNGRSYSLTGAASFAWDFTKAWRAVSQRRSLNKTPFVSGGYDFMLNFAYNATLRFRERY